MIEIDLKLDRREMEVIIMTASGLSAKEIAIKLGLSIQFINHIKRDLRRLIGANTDAHMVHFAIKHGLIKLGDTL